jgi:acetyltransferase
MAATDITLRDGRAIHLRAVRPEDEDEILQAFSRIDEHSRYMRFMRTVKEPNVERLRKVLASFPASGTGLVATVPATDGIDIAGSAVYILEGSDSCEFAITVTPDFARTGLGSVLMQALIDSARERGLREMQGFVLAENQPMLGLARRLGLSIERDPDDASVRICRLRLGEG